MNKVGIVVALMIALTAFGCQSAGATTATKTSTNTSDKLSTQLARLVEAEGQGRLTAFAEQNAIPLQANKVRVIVEVLPGQAEAAANAATKLGTVEARDANLLQVLVPVSNLNALAASPFVSLVRLPRPVLPAAPQLPP